MNDVKESSEEKEVQISNENVPNEPQQTSYFPLDDENSDDSSSEGRISAVVSGASAAGVAIPAVVVAQPLTVRHSSAAIAGARVFIGLTRPRWCACCK